MDASISRLKIQELELSRSGWLRCFSHLSRLILLSAGSLADLVSDSRFPNVLSISTTAKLKRKAVAEVSVRRSRLRWTLSQRELQRSALTIASAARHRNRCVYCLWKITRTLGVHCRVCLLILVTTL